MATIQEIDVYALQSRSYATYLDTYTDIAEICNTSAILEDTICIPHFARNSYRGQYSWGALLPKKRRGRKKRIRQEKLCFVQAVTSKWDYSGVIASIHR